ncbi:protein ApaG [Agarivorans sp. OAG1]|jgi:ApaG protein|uniref:Protein ApaG n=2 Tax=Agarivorans TaxID=261825 RepID=R9PRR6_AGAAL|nr:MULTISPECIES: Co2+/Mg2+ efflux protein ApaG [Agarivorans]BEU01738.1 protein ApaG [Agarivorans sp. OAG1]MEE1672305.1 Co2+/Mg2+ efflux protein ApaG [Agarivorans aestuarii]MPW31397.1 Co2+/Mg2+ efflux protein ApaG [Agarivorans sp. B2Z047]UQN42441.1 Co2+/Mg2+ efflux protein ApaG [Agarivorans sp. B2Z047]GAD03968.1 apaG protein [Agarivorans albus MKT 106]
MSNTPEYDLDIEVESGFLPEHSVPEKQQFAFFYTITIRNCSAEALQLLRRHWVITDGDGKVNEVKGDGVVGKQPHLKPEKPFSYTSSAVLATEVGVMQGSYTLIDEAGNEFEAEIPPFRLSLPNKLH